MARNMKNVWYLYQGRRVCTRATNDGLTIIDVSVAAGQVAKVISAGQVNSGTNDIVITRMDEDNAQANVFGFVASGAARSYYIPAASSTAGTTGGQSSTIDPPLLGPGEKIRFQVSGNGANGDTVTVTIVALMSTPTELTWSVASSTGTAPTLAASTISTANTLQAVVM